MRTEQLQFVRRVGAATSARAIRTHTHSHQFMRWVCGMRTTISVGETQISVRELSECRSHPHSYTLASVREMSVWDENNNISWWDTRVSSWGEWVQEPSALIYTRISSWDACVKWEQNSFSSWDECVLRQVQEPCTLINTRISSWDECVRWKQQK